MEPTKDETHAIVEFVDVLLRDGAVIQADVIVTVADIPLLGISLRAAIAGMTTMTAYGMFENWDATHRQRSMTGGRTIPVPNEKNGK
ncbi:gas vesicle protein [Haloferax mediterranei ATCC 33500]|uniref:Gas vesicle protein M n=2 Tax=Haloferax mediterranei (strain ATCC 33500 / DSM 1411 / JCM 8866 / NBRC 14739 / NCIMB 2177 / R-4) TaxID=523841 RepID=GVPM_HALMT|nr:gas vesicle protein [Haloferax mediterranei]Q02238.1 RecName: Full=Gas vesicle protein M; Short=GvpM [Haloferax mediterranei ATCC 33500]AFK19412.1 gas-vesicle operon protein gvpM [Haloferax mediterranei ATCC 33500]AHZ21238.1 gas vesicle protein GvpM [Haloferax mediterranei ATCC 33500]EMA04399.1 gas-vesicle operon protein gvpM [Haloferax mediterranei ATCC 33500]MDX5989515.1 gas vesicle protein [Haloferax mediterranei ATCC 33500]QCQ75874.1 gas vesicle protein [Haloferax mediterranei ATCC 335